MRAGSHSAPSRARWSIAPEVRDLMMAARAVADPTDQFSCVMALRSPLFGCGDDDLWTWKQARGSFTVTAPTEQVIERFPMARIRSRRRWTIYAGCTTNRAG